MYVQFLKVNMIVLIIQRRIFTEAPLTLDDVIKAQKLLVDSTTKDKIKYTPRIIFEFSQRITTLV
jgi:maltose-binding protein MalE